MQTTIEINAHHIGKSHMQNGLECEDYSISYSDENMSVIAISDGHGDKNCFRSALGAKFACEIAVMACRQFQTITNHINSIEECDFESLIVSLETDIADAWKEKVKFDVESNPFTEDELADASEQAQSIYRNGQRLEKAYGCTLIIAMQTKGFWLTIQIGDGKCIAAYPDGVFVEPIPVDENCLGNRSTSLCNSNAKELFRHYYSSVLPIAVFVSSDGVEESFDQAGLNNCFYSLAYWLKEEGYDAAQEKINELLPQISNGGSGDDVSFAIMASLEVPISKPRQTLEQIYERVNACSNALEQCHTQFENTKERISEKDKELDCISREITQLKEKLQEKEEKQRLIEEEVKRLQADLDELSTRVDRATEQVEKSKQYKVSAERYWFAEFDKLGLVYQPADEGKDQGKEKNSLEEKSSEIEKNSDLEIKTFGSALAVESSDEGKDSESNTDIEQMPRTNQIENKEPILLEFEDAGDLEQKENKEIKENQVRRFWPFSKQPKQ